MNLRISRNRLRFRITREELRALLQGEKLHLALPFAPALRGCRVRAETLGEPLLLRRDGDEITLIAHRDALLALAAQLPSREGIEHMTLLDAAEWSLVLEVDVRREA